MTKSLALYKFVYLEKFGGGGQYKLYRAWDLVKLGGVQKKKSPCLYVLIPSLFGDKSLVGWCSVLSSIVRYPISPAFVLPYLGQS